MWDLIAENAHVIGGIGLLLGLAVSGIAWRLAIVRRDRKRRKEDKLRRLGV